MTVPAGTGTVIVPLESAAGVTCIVNVLAPVATSSPREPPLTMTSDAVNAPDPLPAIASLNVKVKVTGSLVTPALTSSVIVSLGGVVSPGGGVGPGIGAVD